MDENSIPVATPAEQPAKLPTQQASGRAVATLILGILSIVCLGFLTGIPAIITGSMELKAIKSGTAPAAGESIAKVGYILGIIGTVLTCVALLISAAVMVLGISLGTMGAFKEAVNSV